jgi:hypothetical protein
MFEIGHFFSTKRHLQRLFDPNYKIHKVCSHLHGIALKTDQQTFPSRTGSERRKQCNASASKLSHQAGRRGGESIARQRW